MNTCGQGYDFLLKSINVQNVSNTISVPNGVKESTLTNTNCILYGRPFLKAKTVTA